METHYKCKSETDGLGLHEHLAAAEAQENAPRSKRHHELRPAVPSVSPVSVLDPTLNGNPYNLSDDDDIIAPGTRALKGNRKELSTTKRAKQNRDAQVGRLHLDLMT